MTVNMRFKFGVIDLQLNAAIDLWRRKIREALANSGEDVFVAYNLFQSWIDSSTELANAVEIVAQLFKEISRLRKCGMKEEAERLQHYLASAILLNEFSDDAPPS